MPDAITDEGVARLRRRIGVARPHSAPPHYLSPNEDAFRHVAEAYGDDNPLWCDPSYGATTRWGGPIAPPHLVGGETMVGEDEVTRLEGETRELMKGDPVPADDPGRAGQGGRPRSQRRDRDRPPHRRRVGRHRRGPRRRACPPARS